MSTPTRSDQDLSRREELTVSSAVMSGAPWAAATVTGGVVAAGDLGLHVIGSGLGLGALSGSVAMGAVAFFVVAAAGALWRAKPSRAIRWARSNPWRFAVLPAIACAGDRRSCFPWSPGAVSSTRCSAACGTAALCTA